MPRLVASNKEKTMKMTLIRNALAAVVLWLSLFAGAHAQHKLLLSTFFPSTHPIYAEVMVPWARGVEAATQGRVKVEFSPSSLAPPPGQLDMVQKGIADITLQFTGVVPNRLQLELVTELPGPVADSARMSQALWSTHERFFRKAGEYKGLHLLALVAFPPQELFCAKEPYTTLEQLRSAKIATTPGTAAHQYGAVTTGVVAGPAVRFFETVSKGIVDAYAGVTPIDVMSFNLAPSTRCAIRFPDLRTAGSFALVAGERKWKEIAEGDRAAIDAISGKAFAERMAVMDRANAAATQKLLDAGVKFHDASAQFTAELKKAWSFLDEEWIREAGKRGIDGATALEYYRAQVRGGGTAR